MSTPFTGSEFFLESVQQYALATVRVRFTQDPLAANPAGVNDGLNPTNYSLSGPAANAILSVGPVFGDPQAVDLFLQQPLQPGTWTLTVASNVQMWDTTSILTPRIMSFTASALVLPEAVSAGAVDDTAADLLRKHLNTALVGAGWDAIIEAMATGDDKNRILAESAFDQLFKISAGGLYLDRKSGDDGLVRPSNLGMPDDLFRQYSIRATTGKLVENAILDILEVFYGSDSVRAHADSIAFEPYLFQDGDDLQVLVDERDAITITFSSTDFAVPGTARAAEVAAAITRAFRVNGLSAYALALVDPTTGSTGVRIYSGAIGLASAVRVTGGKAQYALRFPTYLNVFTGLPTWTLTYTAVTSTLRLQPNGNVDLSQLRIGDYMTLFGTEFNAGNRGTYVITNVYYAYSPGLTQYIEVVNSTGVAEIVAQVSAASLNFFRPAKQSAYTDVTRAVIVACPGDGLDVTLPATSQAVGRGPKQAAYLPGQSAKTVTSVKRIGTTVTVSCTAHGLSVGDMFMLDGVYSTYTKPSTIAGTAPDLDASLVSIYAATAYIVDPRPVGGSGVRRHTMTMLQDGRALRVGGLNPSNTITNDSDLITLTGPVTLGTGEKKYTISWAAGAQLTNGVAAHSAVLLNDGRVLVVGGLGTIRTQLYTPAPPAGAGSWVLGPNMSDERNDGRTVVLTTGPNSGKALLVGGYDGVGNSRASTDLFNPTSNTLAGGGSMNVARNAFNLITLADGRVLVAGGAPTSALTSAFNTTEIYDPATNTWSFTGVMTWARINAAMALLPDGRVLIAGGQGYEPTQSASVIPLFTTEIYDPATGRWTRGPDMLERHSGFDLITFNGRIYAVNGTDYTNRPIPVGFTYPDNNEYLDLTTMRWKRGAATISPSRTGVKSVLLGNAVMLGVGGQPSDGSANTKTSYALVPASETVGASLNGTWRVASVVDANTFTFTTADSGYFLSTTGTITPEKALTGIAGDPGPYIYDSLNGLGVTNNASAISTQLSQGHQYGYIDVADATQFPDTEGWVVFGFGYNYQVGPVKYLGRLSSTRIALDFSFKFTATVPAGAVMTLLIQKGPWTPEVPESVGSFYVTGSAAGRVAAEAAVDAAVAAGITVNKTITYPGDRGLGGEGLPASGVNKLSDKVEIWAGDDVDAEVEAAREE